MLLTSDYEIKVRQDFSENLCAEYGAEDGFECTRFKGVM
jgi:hypothetical protein